MTAAVPYALPVTANWAVADWLDKPVTGKADSTGVALIELGTLPDDTRWQITHMVQGATTAARPVMRLYLDSVSTAGIRDGSSSGVFDVADWAMGLMVPPGRSLLARWTGLNPGDAVFLNVQANVLRRVS